MKKNILGTLIIASFCSYSSNYLVIVDEERNEYEVVDHVEVIEYTPWTNENTPYNCINKTPLESEIYEGVNFDQDADCDQDQTRDKLTYSLNTKTGNKTLISTEKESQTVNIPSTLNVVGTYEAISCEDVSLHAGDQGNGFYNIKPSSTKISAYCDMNNGGYTIYTMSHSSTQLTPATETACSNLGMKLFVPRTQEHLTDAVKQFGTSYFYLMGLYPNYKGARCSTVYFNSNTCTEWSPSDNGKWFVYNWDMSYPHNGGGVGVYPEPNGDNDVNLSMFYEFDNSTGLALRFNDIASDNPSYPGGYGTTKWACSSIGEENL